jgi:hypothetical protein
MHADNTKAMWQRRRQQQQVAEALALQVERAEQVCTCQREIYLSQRRLGIRQVY